MTETKGTAKTCCYTYACQLLDGVIRGIDAAIIEHKNQPDLHEGMIVIRNTIKKIRDGYSRGNAPMATASKEKVKN